MRIVEIVIDRHFADTVAAVAKEHGATDFWSGTPGPDGRQSIRMLVPPARRQQLLDTLQGLLTEGDNTRLLVYPLEVSLPRGDEGGDETATQPAVATREELYDQVERGARLDRNFLLLVCLSTIVATIGLLEDNTAVVIGAMVIAPLLGPNIALALGTALGDTQLMGKALVTNLAGLSLALALAAAIGQLWPLNVESRELMARTDVGLDGVALALASGAAAVLSVTSGLSSVLVGVMVAVALLPPTATLGLMLGSGQWPLAAGAGLLLAVNVVCVNLAAKVVFLSQGIKPRAWHEELKARQSMTVYLLLWAMSLLILLAVIYLREAGIHT